MPLSPLLYADIEYWFHAMCVRARHYDHLVFAVTMLVAAVNVDDADIWYICIVSMDELHTTVAISDLGNHPVRLDSPLSLPPPPFSILLDRLFEFKYYPKYGFGLSAVNI